MYKFWAKSPKKNSYRTALDKFSTVLTTCQNVCRRSKTSRLKVRKELKKNLFRTTRLPQQIHWNRSKRFWFPCQNFPLGFWNSLWNIFFPNNPSSRKCNPGHVPCNFTTRAEKVSRKFEVFFALFHNLVKNIMKENYLWKGFSGITECSSDNITRSCRQKSDLFAEWSKTHNRLCIFQNKLPQKPQKAPVNELEAVLGLRRKCFLEVQTFFT